MSEKTVDFILKTLKYNMLCLGHNSKFIKDPNGVKNAFMSSLLCSVPFASDSVRILDDIMDDEGVIAITNDCIKLCDISFIDCLFEYQNAIIEVVNRANGNKNIKF